MHKSAINLVEKLSEYGEGRLLLGSEESRSSITVVLNKISLIFKLFCRFDPAD